MVRTHAVSSLTSPLYTSRESHAPQQRTCRATATSGIAPHRSRHRCVCACWIVPASQARPASSMHCLYGPTAAARRVPQLRQDDKPCHGRRVHTPWSTCREKCRTEAQSTSLSPTPAQYFTSDANPHLPAAGPYPIRHRPARICRIHRIRRSRRSAAASATATLALPLTARSMHSRASDAKQWTRNTAQRLPMQDATDRCLHGRRVARMAGAPQMECQQLVPTSGEDCGVRGWASGRQRGKAQAPRVERAARIRFCLQCDHQQSQS